MTKEEIIHSLLSKKSMYSVEGSDLEEVLNSFSEKDLTTAYGYYQKYCNFSMSAVMFLLTALIAKETNVCLFCRTLVNKCEHI